MNLTDYYYVLVSVPKVFPIPMSLGVCSPKNCSIRDFNYFKPYMVKFINGAIPEVFEGVKGFDITTTVTENDIVFEDSKKKNAEATHANALSWIVILLLSFFLLAIALSSVAHWYLTKEQILKSKSMRRKSGKRSKKHRKSKRINMEVE